MSLRLCEGNYCKLRDTCKRYTANPEGISDWLINTPYESTHGVPFEESALISRNNVTLEDLKDYDESMPLSYYVELYGDLCDPITRKYWDILWVTEREDRDDSDDDEYPPTMYDLYETEIKSKHLYRRNWCWYYVEDKGE